MISVYVPRRFTSSSWQKPWAEVSPGNCAGGSKGKERVRPGQEGGRGGRDDGIRAEAKVEGESQGKRLHRAECSSTLQNTAGWPVPVTLGLVGDCR